MLDRQDHSGVKSIIQEIVLQCLLFVLLIRHRGLLDPHLRAEGESPLLFGDPGGSDPLNGEAMLQENLSFVAAEAILSFEVEGDTGDILLVAVDEFEAGGGLQVPDS